MPPRIVLSHFLEEHVGYINEIAAHLTHREGLWVSVQVTAFPPPDHELCAVFIPKNLGTAKRQAQAEDLRRFMANGAARGAVYFLPKQHRLPRDLAPLEAAFIEDYPAAKAAEHILERLSVSRSLPGDAPISSPPSAETRPVWLVDEPEEGEGWSVFLTRLLLVGGLLLLALYFGLRLIPKS